MDDSDISCEIDRGSFLSNEFQKDHSTSFDKLIIVEYNIDRNGLGGDGPNEIGLEGILNAIKYLGPVDVLILSEIARDCPEYGYVNGAEYLAKALQMEYAYAVEFLSTNKETTQKGYQCTNGNAILSNRPLTEITQKWFESQCCKFPERAGGRVIIKANIPAYNLTVLSSHLESGTGISDFIDSAIIRELQSREMVAMVKELEVQQSIVIIGGDFNSPLRQFDKGIAFQCYFDPTISKYSWPNRNTAIDGILSTMGIASFDYVYFRNIVGFDIEGSICKEKECYGYSDHYPLQFIIKKKQKT